MYITKNLAAEGGEYFDWETYFAQEASGKTAVPIDTGEILLGLREHLKEDRTRMTLAMTRLMRTVLGDVPVSKPRIMELGAATGFLTRWFISEYGGSGVLVDS
ncbi:MAG: hypothetical protein GY940_22210, partial [bacterium]|nr:hypothetical protein [bacterium]